MKKLDILLGRDICREVQYSNSVHTVHLRKALSSNGSLLYVWPVDQHVAIQYIT